MDNLETPCAKICSFFNYFTCEKHFDTRKVMKCAYFLWIVGLLSKKYLS